MDVRHRDSGMRYRPAWAAAIVLAACAGAGLGPTPAAALDPYSLVPEPYTIAPEPFWIPSEVRGGILDHALEDSPSERAVAANLEVLGGRLPGGYENAILDYLLTPRPDIGTTIAFGNRKTDEFYWGLTWDAKLFGPTFLEGFAGGAVHDGPTDTKGLPSYGCEVNFREGLSLGYAVTPQWRVMAEIDHMSNANLCHPNHGLTNAGLRLGYLF
jgi:Lipid A 3-O-deacylase (PagL)